MTRKSKWSPELGQSVCDLIAEGWTCKDACAKHSITDHVFREWCRRSDPEFTKLARQYQQARDIQADTLVDKAIKCGNDAMEGGMPPDQARAASYIFFRAAQLLNPRKYYERVDVNANVTATRIDIAVPEAFAAVKDSPALAAIQAGEE